MDLMQEHHIRELKDKAQRRDTDFEGAFFQHVISRNIRWFSATRTAVTTALSQGYKTGSSAHGRSNNFAAISQLLSSLELEGVHSFVSGRSYNWLSRDNLTEGRRLMPTKLQHFLRRTTANMVSSELEVQETVGPLEQDGLYPEGDNTEASELNDPGPELPAPGMLIDGRYVPGNIEDPEIHEVNMERMPLELQGL
ncbi:hypothetical protein BN14_11853 [Rhizoctonia solani AG-1 IB]|uniref:DUF6589 domain-containing protein n=1 Tax=Thanatephorus cucumeris (strain AG1-IB / isolate 7/3/14) TaxID=1108050 RepID=M5CEL4_THACB|nr:hypothetical protein BN14_11853 [Rhizoctonia solani AG-1 IB]